MNKIYKTILFILPISIFMTSCGVSDDTPTITFSHILNNQSEWHVGPVEWKKRVEKQSNGEIKIRIVTNSSLSNNNQRTELEMVQTGGLGGSWESTILLTITDPRWTLWSMPWLFDSYEEAERICESELGKEYLGFLEEKGIVGLAYGFNGFRRLTNNQRPVANLADLRDLKIRVPYQQMYISLFRLWGADPSTMNFGDLMMALREGAMDGQENPLHVIHSTSLYELQDHLTMWEYSFDPLIFCMSKIVWDRFTPEQQDMLRKTAQEAAAIQRQTVIENEEKHLEFLKQQGMEVTVPSPEAIEEFKDASQPIYEEYRSEIGGDLMDRFLQATEES